MKTKVCEILYKGERVRLERNQQFAMASVGTEAIRQQTYEFQNVELEVVVLVMEGSEGYDCTLWDVMSVHQSYETAETWLWTKANRRNKEWRINIEELKP